MLYVFEKNNGMKPYVTTSKHFADLQIKQYQREGKEVIQKGNGLYLVIFDKNGKR